MKTIKGYTSFDKRIFPIPDERFNDLAWRLRYAQETITKNEFLYLAAVLNAYKSFIYNTNKDNSYINKRIKESLSPGAQLEDICH